MTEPILLTLGDIQERAKDAVELLHAMGYEWTPKDGWLPNG